MHVSVVSGHGESSPSAAATAAPAEREDLEGRVEDEDHHAQPKLGDTAPGVSSTGDDRIRVCVLPIVRAHRAHRGVRALGAYNHTDHAIDPPWFAVQSVPFYGKGTDEISGETYGKGTDEIRGETQRY